MISLLKLENQIEKTAKSIDEAKEALLLELGLEEDEVEFEVVEEGTKGFLGIGSKEAKVLATIKEPVTYKAKAFLSQVFSDMNLEVDIKTTFSDDNLLVEMSGENMGIVIGKRGDTLDSLQYLTSLIVNKGSDTYIKVTLDTENYREKRNQALEALAERLAKKVSKTGKKYTLEPMNPYERRIIHSILQANDEVTTFSVGEDPYRKVVIAPKNVQRTPHYKKPLSSYPHPKKQPSYDSFDSYSKENSLFEDEE